MKITLSNFKFYPSMSEETNCFEANFLIDGVKVGTTNNRGTGGPTDYHPNRDDKSIAAMKEAEEFCIQLPPLQLGENWGSIPMNLEHFIDELVEAAITEKLNKKALASFKKRELNSIIMGQPNQYLEYRYIQFKMPFATIFAHPMLLEKFKASFLAQKKGLKEGEVILNTNIPADVLSFEG